MAENLIDIVKEAGVVGAGGAGFPTHIKLNAQVEYVLVNGAECEPLIRVDQELLAKRTKEIITALKAAVEHTGAKKGIIALKSKYKPAIVALKREIAHEENLEIFEMGNFYPAGDEQVLVYEATGRIVPEGGIPLNVGAIVINVETLYNVYHAMHDIPVTKTYITITGEVANPITVKVPIGITVRETIELAGGSTIDDFVVIDGGPLMGKVVGIDDPVTKTTKALIVLDKDHPHITSKEKDIQSMLKVAKTACMHCSLCTEVCPRYLIGHHLRPDRLIRMASYNSTCDSNALATEAFLCCDCTLCQYACVMDLQPWKLHGELKKQLSQLGIKNPNNRKPEKAHPTREYRKFPVPKLIARLGITKYDVDAALMEKDFDDFDTVKIPLKQHIGGPAKAIVNVGDTVKMGQVIGDIEDSQLGAKVHASIDGRVVSIEDGFITIKNN